MHHVNDIHLEALKSSWIGPDNCMVNTVDTDTVETARSEWIQVYGAPFHPKFYKLTSVVAFVCLDIRELYDQELSHVLGVIGVTAPKLNRKLVLSCWHKCKIMDTFTSRTNIGKDLLQ